MLQRFDFKPDILHLNDWHTAPLAMLLRENEREHQELSDISIVYTIHSLEYQGVSDRSIFNLFGVKDIVFKMDKVEYYGCFNAMKAGLNYADIINGVSRTFTRQMLSPEFGFGLDGVLKSRKSALRGVVNGISIDTWNPETDNLIYTKYNKESLAGKKENKSRLQKDLGLEQSAVPVFSVVSRLVPNKGLDLMEGAALEIVREGGQFILLGSGEKYYENAFLRLMDRYPGSVSVNLEFNNDKAHKIYAGSDLFLMPSRYEPCGLSQLIAMRYGTIPLVHKTGGLADTVTDESRSEGQGTGFSFAGYSHEALLKALRKALDLYRNKEAWEQLVVRAMSRDSSWEASAKEYLLLYNEAIEENRKRKTKGRKTVT
jgi:starch synthase